MSEDGLAAFPHYQEAVDRSRRFAGAPQEALEEHAARLAHWFREYDPGSGDQAWFAQVLDTADWPTMSLPVLWEEGGFGTVDGVGWFRKSFDLPDDWAGQDLELRLSAIDDLDTTWVNGCEIGSTVGYSTPRVYRVPVSLSSTLRDCPHRHFGPT